MEVKIKENKIVGVIDRVFRPSINLNSSVLMELLSTKKSMKKIKDSLKIVSLNEDILPRSFLEISMGERQKVLLAKELLKNEKTITLENPTYALDTNAQKNLIKLIKLMKVRYNKTVVILSNDIEFLHKIADYIFLMDNGNVVLEGTKYNVFLNTKLLKEYNIKIPLIMQFSNLVKNRKNIDIGYRDDINDLMKDIYRFADK